MRYFFLLTLILGSCHQRTMDHKAMPIQYFKSLDFLKMEGIDPTQDTVNQPFVRIEKKISEDSLLQFTHYDILVQDARKLGRVKRYSKYDSLWACTYLITDSFEPNTEVSCYKQFIDIKNKIFVEYELKSYFDPPGMRLQHLFIRDSVLFQQYAGFPDTLLSKIALNYENAASVKAFADLSVSNYYKLEKTKLHVERTFLDKSDKIQKIDSTITHEYFEQPTNGTWLIKWNGIPGVINGMF